MPVILNEVKNLGRAVFRPIPTKILHFVQNDKMRRLVHYRNRMIRKILLLSLQILLCSTLLAAPGNGGDFRYRMDNISLNRGLAQHDVSSITQDRYGFLWIATYNGLHRYDGYEFRIFKHRYDDPGTISDNRILFVMEDSRSRLLIATEGGGLNLYDYDTDLFTTFRFGDNPVDNNIYCITEDPSGALWIGSSSGLYRAVIGPDDAFSYERYDSPPGIHAVAVLPSGSIFLGSERGASILNDASNPRGGHRPVAAIQHQMVYRIADAGENKVLIGCDAGLYLSDLYGACTKVDLKPLNDGVRAILRLDRDRLLVGTARDGVMTLTGKEGGYELTPLYVESSLLLNRSIIKALVVDRMENLWIGTGTNGVFRVNLAADRFYRIFNASNDGGSFVRAFLKDSYDRMWIQTRQSLFRVVLPDGAESLIDPGSPTVEDNMVVGITEDPRRNVWFCSGRRIFEVPAGSDARRPRGLDADPVFARDIAPRVLTFHSIASDDRGTVWVGVWNGLLRIRPAGAPGDRYMFYDNFDFQKNDIGVVNIFCDREHGKLWACSRNYGLVMVDLDAQDNITGYTLFSLHGPQEKQLSSNHVWSVLRASDGVVWVGTDTGLNSIELPDGQAKVRRNGLPERLMSDKILGICQDAAGDLWLSTSDGLLRYSPAGGTMRQYNARDGLSSSGLTEGITIGPDGFIYVPTINGVTWFDPREIRPDPYAPLARITGLRIFNKEVGVGEKVNGRVILKHSILETEGIRLRYNQNNFTVLFVGLHFGNSARSLYSYKLEGYDKEWVTGPPRDLSASYNNLPAGRYRFLVRAANSDGLWSERDASLWVEIGKAPWLTWWAYAIYALVLFGAVYVVFNYYRRQQLLRNNLYIEQLKHKHDRQMSEQRERFHANITHELRTPLTLISSPLKDLATRLADDEWVASRLELIGNNTRRLLLLVNQFLDMNKIDSDNMQLNVREVDVDLLAGKVVDDFRLLARQKNINLAKVSEFSPIMGLFDQDKVNKILFNLISNAVKFTPDGGSISVILSPQEETLTIDVEDTGCGIPGADLERIFDRFYQAPGTSASGTGIGLSLVRKLVELHHGRVGVTSVVGRGSRFSVTLPLNPAVYPKAEIATPKPQSDPLPRQGKEKPIVLVVEDDDDMRRYLEQSLGAQFDVLAESNAPAGRETALRYMPDLIITDVMMAGMSGFELCEQLKSDFRTSHIPIIILTAKSDPRDVTEGLRTGAENYLTKPFDSEQLLLKVTNIITYSRRQAKVAASAAEPEAAPALNEREQKFMDKLIALIDRNMEDADYSVEDICRDFGVSRMQLHRKLTALVGKTTSEFIRDVKMARARELIESGNYNVSETVYKVGFKSNSHFSKTFKATYGITPSEFARKKNG